MVRPRFPDKSPKLILRTPLLTAFWKTPAKKYDTKDAHDVVLRLQIVK